jgi:O-antigen ligase
MTRPAQQPTQPKLPTERVGHRPAPTTRAALLLLQVAAPAVVLAALPYQLFQLDRFLVPKELVLHTAALGAGLLCLAAARRLTLLAVDALLIAFLVFSLLSTLLASNGWLGFRALGVSVAGAVLFWSARAIARVGLGSSLLTALAVAVVAGAVTALLQTYGQLGTAFSNLSRAPGGTFGNRNFMAHLVTIGLPMLLLVAVQARSRAGFGLGAVGVTLAAAALVLSRSRAAWLGAGAAGLFLAVEGLWIGRLWTDERLRKRVLMLATLALSGLVLALALPNRLNWRSESPYLDSLTGVANYKEGSGRGRLIQYRNTLIMAADHPLLGVGPGNWPVYYPRYMSPDDPSFDADDIIPTNPWPSSDWVAMLAERGVPAFLLLGMVGGAIALGAWARVRGSRYTPALTDLAIVATLMAVAVVGAFDAVLLLPIPTLFAWIIVGTLASSARPIREFTLSSQARRRLLVGLGLLGGAFLLRSSAQGVAMGLYQGATRRAMELAARVDPANYRIHMLLAQSGPAAGRCARVRRHAGAAADLFPSHPAPRLLLRRCGLGRQ